MVRAVLMRVGVFLLLSVSVSVLAGCGEEQPLAAEPRSQLGAEERNQMMLEEILAEEAPPSETRCADLGPRVTHIRVIAVSCGDAAEVAAHWDVTCRELASCVSRRFRCLNFQAHPGSHVVACRRAGSKVSFNAT